MAGGREAPRSQGASDDKDIIKRQRDLREDDPLTPLGDCHCRSNDSHV